MIIKYKNIFVDWFKKTFIWWVTSLFGRIGIIFAIAAFILVFLTYFVINWEFVSKDTILDAHDAYHHYQMIENWNLNHEDANINHEHIRAELNNLRISCAVYRLEDVNNAYEKCQNDVFINPVWIHTNQDLALNVCDYQSYNDTELIDSTLIANGSPSVQINGYVSFGQIANNNNFYEASVVEDDKYRYLVAVTDYSPPDDILPFIPPILLATVFMFILFLIVKKFLSPINIIQKRIRDLEKGDLESTINVSGQDELAILSLKFNNLILQIKKLLNQKEGLLSDVSHELRTPLAKIKLLLELELTDKNKEKINDQIQYLDSLITNILIADKMSAPYSELDISSIQIKDLIAESIEYSKIKNIKIKIINNDCLNIDVIKMSVVIKNLLDNAVKYGQANTKPVELSAFVTQHDSIQYMNIAIKDFGPGIPEEMIEKIIKPFVQVNQKESGFGLGLAICKKVLQAHKGYLKIKNNKDKGCTFIASFPIIA